LLRGFRAPQVLPEHRRNRPTNLQLGQSARKWIRHAANAYLTLDFVYFMRYLCQPNSGTSLPASCSGAQGGFGQNEIRPALEAQNVREIGRGEVTPFDFDKVHYSDIRAGAVLPRVKLVPRIVLHESSL